MIYKIARKEFVEMWRDGRFRLAAGLIFLLLVAAFFVGWRHAASVGRERAAAQDVSREQWLKLPAMNPHSAAHYSIFAFKPVAPLALADTGVDPFAGVAVWLEAHSQNEATYAAARDATGAARFGQLTAATILQILIPLGIILLAFGAFAVEREQGTWRQMLALGVSRGQIALGKSFGIALALGALLVPAAFLGAAALALSSKSAVFSATFWFGVAALVNLYGGKSATNALALAAIWIGLILIVPTLAHLTATAVRPVPPRLELIAASRDFQVNSRRPVELLEAYYAKHPERRPVKKDLNKYDFPFYYTAIQREIDRQIAPLVERSENALDAQQNFVRTISVASPALAAQEIFNDLAGTGYPRNRAFYRQMMEFYQAHLAFFEVKAFSDTPLSSADYDQMPRFAFREESNGELFSRLVWQFVPLMILTALIWILIWRKLSGLKLDFE